jgi:hypothetical protein
MERSTVWLLRSHDKNAVPAGTPTSRRRAALFQETPPLGQCRIRQGSDTIDCSRRCGDDSRHRESVKVILNRAGRVTGVEWEILMTSQVEAFLDELYESDRSTHRLVNQAILVLERNGPAEGRPLVDNVTMSKIPNMKELRPPSGGRSEVRILLCFDPWRSAILLVAGDKSGQWNRWYRQAVPQAEKLYATYLEEREKEVHDDQR